MNFSIRKMIEFQILFIFFFASWTNAFALSGILLVPILILGIIFLSWFLDVSLINEGFELKLIRADYYAILFVLISLYSGLTNSNTKTIGYVFAYSFSFLLLNIVLRNIIVNYGNLRAINKVNLITVIFVSVFILFDFMAHFFYQFQIQDYLHRSVKADAVYFIFPRSYGFSEEPTYLAWYLNTLGVLAVYYLWNRVEFSVVIKILFSTLVFIGWLLTFSTAGIGLLVISFFLAVGIKFIYDNFSITINKLLIYRLLLAIFLILVPLTLYILTLLDFDLLQNFFSGFYEKITLNQGQSGDRQNVWANDLSIALQKPFLGFGIGYMSSRDIISSLNLFIFTFYENGFLAVICLILFYVHIGLNILYAKIEGKLIFLTAYIAGVLHLMTMTQHYHPNLWLLIGVFFLQKDVVEKGMKSNGK